MIRDFGKFLMLICFSLIERFMHLSGEAQFWDMGDVPRIYGLQNPNYLIPG